LAGALTGFVIGFLNTLTDKPEGGISALSGTTAGALAGLLIGLALPVFFNRWLAGAAVSVAATIAFAVAFPLWRDAFSWFFYPFMGAMAGIVYGALMWKQPKPASRLVVNPGDLADATTHSRDA